MLILKGDKVKELDRLAAEEWRIPAAVLMENAGRSFVSCLKQELDSLPEPIVVVAGKGNNGGDGLVIARRLLDLGKEVTAIVLGKSSELNPQTERNFGTLKKMTGKVFCLDPKEGDRLARQLQGAQILIDALFGIGIEGPVRGSYRKVIEIINSSPATVVAVDLPSGLPADTGQPAGHCVTADLTITMGFLKRSNLLPPGPKYCGRTVVAEVGYPRNLIEDQSNQPRLVEGNTLAGLLPERTPYSHKGDFGRVLIVGGSSGMTGAATLTVKSALRSGAGLVHAAVPLSLNGIFEVKLTEALTHPITDKSGALSPDSLEDLLEAAEGKDAIAIGPGLSQRNDMADLVTDFLESIKVPAVIDADGINALSAAGEELKLPPQSIMTPHPGELGRLLGMSPAEVDRKRFELAPEVASDLDVTLILKGIPTVISSPAGELWVANCPNSGLAKGGSGDVLTGLLVGLLAQGVSPLLACRLSTWIHCRSGELASRELSTRSVLPGNLIEKISQAMGELSNVER